MRKVLLLASLSLGLAGEAEASQPVCVEWETVYIWPDGGTETQIWALSSGDGGTSVTGQDGGTDGGVGGDGGATAPSGYPIVRRICKRKNYYPSSGCSEAGGGIALLGVLSFALMLRRGR